MPVSERLSERLAKIREHWNNAKRRAEEEKPQPFLLANIRDVSVAPDIIKPEKEPNWLQRQILLAEKKGRPISKNTRDFANGKGFMYIPEIPSIFYKNGGEF